MGFERRNSGTAATEKRTVRAEGVGEFSGYLAYDGGWESEIFVVMDVFSYKRGIDVGTRGLMTSRDWQ